MGMTAGIRYGYPECCCISFCGKRKRRNPVNTEAPVVTLAIKLIQYAVGLNGFVPCHSCATRIVERGKTDSFLETKEFITGMFNAERKDPLYIHDNVDHQLKTATSGFPNKRTDWSPELQKHLSDFES